MSQPFYLYVEDDRLSRIVMDMFLGTMMGLSSYAIFEDSTDFIARLKALPVCPDVILLDIHVQPLNGFEMLKSIRADPEFQNCRVVALTASVMNEEVKQLRMAGFDGTIGKPLDPGNFPDLLRKIQRGEAVWQIT
jgi:two-component system cell cycle response regulator DivK